MGMIKNHENIYIELIYCENSQALPIKNQTLDTDLKSIGIRHLALRVDSLQDTINLLKQNWCNREYEIFSGKLGRQYFFVNDPDGILLEFIEMPKTV